MLEMPFYFSCLLTWPVGRVTVSTAIFGKGSGKDAARKNVITFFQKILQHQKL